jgi:hypothetical protein
MILLCASSSIALGNDSYPAPRSREVLLVLAVIDRYNSKCFIFRELNIFSSAKITQWREA